MLCSPYGRSRQAVWWINYALGGISLVTCCVFRTAAYSILLIHAPVRFVWIFLCAVDVAECLGDESSICKTVSPLSHVIS